MRNKKWFVFLLVLFSLFCIYEVSAQYGGYFGETGESVIDLYESYSSWFDFFIFLIIFLSLGRVVFGEHFKGAGGTGVYIGIGIFLALALLIWERQAGFSLMEIFGPWVVLLVILIFLFIIFAFMSKVSGSVLFASSVTLFVFWLIFTLVSNVFDIYDWVYSELGFDLQPFMILIFIASIIGMIVGGFFAKKARGEIIVKR